MSSTCRSARTPVTVRELGLVEYLPTWQTQRELAGARADGTGEDTLLLLQHPPVYTAGKRTREAEKPADGTPVIDVDRGGKITYHEPGQLVGYPIIGLADPIDVLEYVRRVEQAIIAVCDRLELPGTGRVDGRTGVWLPAENGLPERKIAAIGVRVARGVTLHGFSINCDNPLGGFDTIIPCGITDAGTTSLSRELGRTVPVEEVLPLARDAVLDALDGTLEVTERDIVRAGAEAPGLRLELST
ncbi:lipoyl(octanoyl) transferase LipB [Sciscionella marina]|uniref:lipoyl(octanoyl) transferase LipB n=1 Tax=Sciscionella marina TaxID=508770 RepID=UPI0003828482|nr:lipoyl(octanoyl) transferase LipB [Sciscionella marina]